MDSTVLSHITALRIQDRLTEANGARAAREVRPPRRRLLRPTLRRRTAPTPAPRMGAGSV